MAYATTRSYHPTKGAARKAANHWKKKGYRVYLEYPIRNLGKQKKFRVVTEGRSSGKDKGHVYDITKTSKPEWLNKRKKR